MIKKADDFIQIRISKQEKIMLKEQAKKAGFDNMSTYLKWLFRQSLMKGKKT